MRDGDEAARCRGVHEGCAHRKCGQGTGTDLMGQERTENGNRPFRTSGTGPPGRAGGGGGGEAARVSGWGEVPNAGVGLSLSPPPAPPPTKTSGETLPSQPHPREIPSQPHPTPPPAFLQGPHAQAGASAAILPRRRRPSAHCWGGGGGGDGGGGGRLDGGAVREQLVDVAGALLDDEELVAHVPLPHHHVPVHKLPRVHHLRAEPRAERRGRGGGGGGSWRAISAAPLRQRDVCGKGGRVLPSSPRQS